MNFETLYSELLVDHYQYLFDEGKKRYIFWCGVASSGWNLEKLKANKDVWVGVQPKFTLDRFRNEISKNVLATDQAGAIKYFHYLIKIQWRLKDIAKEANRLLKDLRSWSQEMGFAELPMYNYMYSNLPYSSQEELFGHTSYLLNLPEAEEEKINKILEAEFQIDTDKWKEFFDTKSERTAAPTIEEIQLLLSQPMVEEPKKKGKELTHKQLIILLEELGIFKSDNIRTLQEGMKAHLFSQLLRLDGKKHRNVYLQSRQKKRASINRCSVCKLTRKYRSR